MAFAGMYASLLFRNVAMVSASNPVIPERPVLKEDAIIPPLTVFIAVKAGNAAITRLSVVGEPAETSMMTNRTAESAARSVILIIPAVTVTAWTSVGPHLTVGNVVTGVQWMSCAVMVSAVIPRCVGLSAVQAVVLTYTRMNRIVAGAVTVVPRGQNVSRGPVSGVFTLSLSIVMMPNINTIMF